MTALQSLARDAEIIVTAGSGGVGKTTTAAVLALEGARAGRRAVVVTIDPAKRLADALGLEGLTNTPSKIEGDWPGELWALMLDTKSTFDDLIVTYSIDPKQAERILGNRFYKNISGALSGTQEYMAMEKLYELHDEKLYDLIVVDTPPTRNALDFLDAPRRLTRLLDNRIFRLLVMPTRAYLKAVSAATLAAFMIPRVGVMRMRYRRWSRKRVNRCGASMKSSAWRVGGVSTTTRSNWPALCSSYSFSIAMYSCVPDSAPEMFL